MGANASRVRRTVDKHASVTLRASGGSDLTGDTVETALSLNERNKAYWDNYEIPNGKMVVAVDVTKADTGGTNAYVLSLLVDDVVAMNNSPVTIASYTIPPGATGYYEFVVDSQSIPALDSDHSSVGKFMAVKAAVSGNGTPKLNYSAWLAKVIGA